MPGMATADVGRVDGSPHDTSMTKPEWYPSQQFGWNSLHCGWGAFVWLFLCLLFGWPWATGILAAWIVAKEFWWDRASPDKFPWGEGDTLASSATDALWYAIGGLTGAAAWGILLWCGRLT